jgi:hypothetical protein
MKILFLAFLTLVSCFKPSEQGSLNFSDSRRSLQPQSPVPVPETPSEPVLGPHRFLRKLSQKIRGIEPSETEHAALVTNLSKKASLDEFFAKKAEEYLTTEEYKRLMHFRIREMLNLDATYIPTELKGSELVREQERNAYYHSTSELIEYVLNNNLPWDQLLLAKRWKSFPRSVYPKDSDLYSSFLNPTEVTSGTERVFENDDGRWAGILTTGAYRTRFVSTEENQNRRFASSVYRSFLCDDLQVQVVPGSADEEDQRKLNSLWAFVRNIPQEISEFFNQEVDYEVQILKDDRARSRDPHFGLNLNKVLEGDPHSTDPACIVCHEKLDPVGRTFGPAGAIALQTTPTPGALVLRRAGEKVEYPVNGIGELAQMIVAQPEYISCQTKKMWNWIIGDEIPMSESNRQYLESVFNSDRKAETLIKTLVQLPEFHRDRRVTFFQDPAGPNVSWDQVIPVLGKCNSCHSSHTINFTQRPWGGDEESDRDWSFKLYRVLGLENDAQTMPPNQNDFAAEELTLLKRYIRQLNEAVQ